MRDTPIEPIWLTHQSVDHQGGQECEGEMSGGWWKQHAANLVDVNVTERFDPAPLAKALAEPEAAGKIARGVICCRVNWRQ